MSYIIELKDKLDEDSFLSLINNDNELAAEKNEGFYRVIFSHAQNDFLTYENGIIQATSPTEVTYKKLCQIAELLGTTIIDEPALSEDERAKVVGRANTIWLGWPIIGLIIIFWGLYELL